MLDTTKSLKIVLGRDVIGRYERATINLAAAKAELAMIEAKLARMIPKLRRELGSDEAVLKWFAENFSASFTKRIRNMMKLK